MLTPEEVRHVAMLARLGLTDEEVEMMRAQLAQVLDYIAMLSEVDTSAVEPTAQVLAQSNIMRGDTSRPSMPVGEVLRNAPGKEETFFRVPSVLEDGAVRTGAHGIEVPANG
ncbi:MAG TPA: Asp-tRNA(Asn)/Glu-tRNA(Gln) amidotransferase subunit GatC [Chloroflexia bacterium]|nr:Asp-tRNA(Asn)/Glu-tRNA(Gln) amidotransferase subunit GatC [Chloroflexia bacterium]